MKHFWKASSTDADSDGAAVHRWVCQLMHVEFDTTTAVFDFVALEPGPAGKGCPRFAPFTVDVDLPDAGQVPLLRAWATEVDVVTITAGSEGRAQWLCLSACDQHVVMGFVDRPDPPKHG